MKLHNALWPGLVGKEPGTDHPPISLDRMLDLTAAASVDGRRFDGVDLFIFHPHIDPRIDDDGIQDLAERIAARGLAVGSLVAPVWPGTVGASAIGDDGDRARFCEAVLLTCRIGRRLRELGIRRTGVVRIDSACNPAAWAADAAGNTRRLADTFRAAGAIAADHGERLAAEGEICWGGMHSWRTMRDTLEATGMPGVVGFQADLAHTYLYLLGCNDPGAALLKDGHSEAEFWTAYTTMTDALGPWTLDVHVAQNDGTVHGTGSHDKTGRHCLADDPRGRLDIVRTAGMWLQHARRNGIGHICWDGCMFPNAVLEDPATWNTILRTMIAIDRSLAP